MQLEPGMRVRCVRGSCLTCGPATGNNYTIREVRHNGWVYLHNVKHSWLPDRFKPIVRVKAPSYHEIVI